MRVYATEQEGAKGLLGEAVKIISQCDIDYVIIGGWIPLLFYSSIYPHPGSFDVDLLLNDKTTSVEKMQTAVRMFKENGYLFSAKNKFQLHKALNILDDQILFHVDFLHRRYAPDQEQGIFINWNSAMSISGPGTDIIFLDNERNAREISFDLPDNTTESVRINFASEIGFIGAKGRSLDVPKRIRDSYDIFLVICQTKNYKELLLKSQYYYHNKLYFKTSIDNIFEFFTQGDKYGNNGIKNTKRYLEEYKPSLKYISMIDDLDKFISDKVCGFIKKVMQR
ncbi:hypothetical protein [Larkinella humicola]|nr:hypothetical protein [Larkinella humicola]